MDDCKNCQYLDECRTGKRKSCVMNETQEVYNPMLPRKGEKII